MKAQILIILSFIFHSSSGQKSNINDSLFLEFKRNIEIEQSDNHGNVVWNTETRIAYYTLLNEISNDELANYIIDSNAAIRSFIFSGLAKKGESLEILNSILQRHFYDTTVFIESPTDVVLSFQVVDYMLMIYKAVSDNKFMRINFKSKIEELSKLDHIIIEGAHNKRIDKKSLMNLNCLVYSNRDIKVISFKTTINEKEFKSEGNKMTKEMKREIDKLKSGEKVYFENIMVAMADNIRRQIGSIWLRIE